MKILEASNHFHNNTIEYIAECELFDEVEQGMKIPIYNLIFETRTNRLPHLTFYVERIKN